jgi:outer membrane protein assembly factor BamB/tetratricopeptide (TPR) repeat protein
MSRQRLGAVLAASGVLTFIGWAITDSVRGQQKALVVQPGGAIIMPGGGPGGVKDGTTSGGSSAASLSAVKIIDKSEYRKVIEVGRACIKDQAWEEAVTALQAMLDNKEDFYVQIRDKDAAGKETTRWTSVKFEANNLIGSMPADGLAVYELRYGTKAKDRLDTAKKKGDRDTLAEVAQRYCHTQAGIEANELLATLFLARGQHFMAALRYEKLLAMDPERTKLSELSLYKAALAFHRAGDDKSAANVWTRLETGLKNQGGLRIGDDMVPMAKLKQVLSEDAGGQQVGAYEWAMVRGNNTNTAQATGSPPLLDSIVWRRPLINDKREETGIGDDEHLTEALVRDAVKLMRDTNQPVMPGFFPIATKGMLVYRTHSGIRSVAIRDVAYKGRVHKPGEIVSNSIRFSAGLANLVDQNGATRSIIEAWIRGAGGKVMQPPNQFQPFQQPGGAAHYFDRNIPGAAGIVYENSTIGTLSTDHQFVYAIDDLAVPPPYATAMPTPFMVVQQQNQGEVRKYVTQNVLMAFNIEKGGKLEWDLGGHEDPQFAESHFLGAPISVGGKLYVLNEKNPPANSPGGESELRLVCIDPTKKTPQGHGTVVEPIQMLGMVQSQSRVSNDITRRTNAVFLAFGEGILVCPTNAGEVFGIDLMNRALVWSYPYREQAHASPFQTNMNMGGIQVFGPGGRIAPPPALSSAALGNWKSAPPAIADGKVVFTAPDANSVHCINVRDGTPVWRSPQLDGDLFMAGVFNGKVLVVGKSSIRALNLHTGQRLWSVPTRGTPSGQGVASKNIYYLPMHGERGGEILAVDIERGMVKARNRAADKAAELIPGNLVFYEGTVLSLTPTDVVAYPQLTARLDAATVALKADPENLEKLTAHGELLLKDGQVNAAVADLEKVVTRKAEGSLGQRAKDRLFEALTDLLQVNFNDTSVKYLDTYRDLCKATDKDEERQQRQARFFRIVGQGREAQGNLVEAFQMYKDFGALPIHNANGGVPSLEDPTHKVPTNVWLRGRISAMISRASAEQRAPLEAKIGEEWKQVMAKKDLDSIRSFVGMFDVPFQVGREARLHLAETVIERNDKKAFLEAEMNLEQLLGPDLRGDPAVGGRALATLAQLEEKKGTADSIALAASYYRELGRNFAKAEVRKGKTGADLLNELPPKLYLPYLEEAKSPWGNPKMGARRMGGSGFATGTPFMMAPKGDLTPFAKQHRIGFEPNNQNNTVVRLIDINTGKDRWSQPLGQVPANNNQVFFQLYQHTNWNVGYNPHARHRNYHIKGHLIVAQVGLTACCFNGDTGEVLWKQPLVDGMENMGGSAIQTVGADNEGNPEFIIFNANGVPGQQRRLVMGKVAAVEAAYVALVTEKKGLVVNDPLLGTPLWKKPDVSVGTHVFGDADYIFLIDGGDGTALGAGRALRAIDGSLQDKIPDFGPVFQHRVAVRGRQILAAVPGKTHLALRLYDVVTGKDVWSKECDLGSTVLQTDDEGLTGVIDTKGNVLVLDAHTGAEILSSNIVRGKIGPEDLKHLQNPLLLADTERFYLALNKTPEQGKLLGQILNNFSNGLRCYPVHGWMLAIHRKDGAAKVNGESRPYKKGDLAWHSFAPLHHQMLVLEMFDQLPVLLFSTRYGETTGVGGITWKSYTQSISKKDGKFVYDDGPDGNNNSPQFYAFNVDPRIGTITMVGQGTTIQHYIDDGRKLPAGASLTPGPGNGRVGPNMEMPAFPGGGLIGPPAGIQVAPLLPPPPPPVKKR